MKTCRLKRRISTPVEFRRSEVVHRSRGTLSASPTSADARGDGGRRGFISLELALTLPVLGIVLMGLFEFALLFFARGEVVEAARAGARKAALPGVTADDVEDEVRRVLQPRLHHDLRVDVELGKRTGDLVTVGISVPMWNASPDLLWPVGYSVRQRELYAETRMIRE